MTDQENIDILDKKGYPRKNDAFFVKKRKIFREAEQLGKSYGCEVFIFVHNKETDKIFQFETDPNFGLE